jgi:PhoPQ-activated pathogenicity-related protein
MRSRVFLAVALAGALVCLLAFPGPPALRADLASYVKKAEPAFAWKLRKNDTTLLGKVYDLELVSQTWQGIKWNHTIQVYVPKKVKPAATLFLYNTGDDPNLAKQAFGLGLAAKMKAPVAFLYNIPNQPLLDKKREDALIAETFVRYLKTRNEDWPLLFPMVKSMVKAMDALQAFAKKEWKVEVKHFVLSGGSKRGWTTWLTGAVDPRVKAIAPLVIDTLNMAKQLPYQLASYGKYSAMIKDYTKAGLVPMPNTPRAKKLWMMVDPWSYRAKLTMPKMLINGANDPYWAQDALNLYWDDLKGPKWVLYIPNAGHDLRQRLVDKKEGFTRIVNTLSAFARHEITNKPMPTLSWKHDEADGKYRLTVQCKPAPKAARLWVADAATRDFRKSTWKEQPATRKGKQVTGLVSRPESGCRAFFAEMEYEMGGMRYYLSTQLRIIGKPAKPVK